MGLAKRALYLNEKQIRYVAAQMQDYKHATRNLAIFQLTYLAGLRAKEVALLRWEHVLDIDNQLGNMIVLTNDITKGNSGGEIPMNYALRSTLHKLYNKELDRRSPVIRSSRGKPLRAQSIVNLLYDHYRRCNIPASSHSGRRTFITNAARKIGSVGGSMRDVQALARHANLQTTQRYIESNSEAQIRVVQLVG